MKHGLLWCALVTAALGLPGRAAAAWPIYLALGDSSAFGETDRTRNPSNGDRGYVAPFADFLAKRYSGARPTVINTAINGETSQSYFTGSPRASADGLFHNTNYAPPYATQQATVKALAAKAAAGGGHVDVVTVQFGANDLFVVAEAPGFLGKSPLDQQAEVGAAIAALQQNYAGILGEVRTLFPDAEVFVMGYHNPYGSSPEHPFYPLGAPAVKGVNAVAAGLAPLFGATYVDVYSVIDGKEHDLTLIDEGYNVHLNDAGYAAAADRLIATATPEPGTFALCAIGLAGAAGYRRRRASRAA
jgi:lysophospholipase L1-like esterase